MASVRIPDEQRTLTDQADVTAYLATLGIDYERWPLSQRAAANAPAEAVLAAYAPEIERLKLRGGYVTADLIDVTAATPNLETMLAKFSTEHWHDEDEVRFIIRGRGLFHIHPKEGPVIAIERAPDMLTVSLYTKLGGNRLGFISTPWISKLSVGWFVSYATCMNSTTLLGPRAPM